MKRSALFKYASFFIPAILGFLVTFNMAMLDAQETEAPPLSAKSRMCLGCHPRFTPGIVEDWNASRHSRISPKEALQRPSLERRISAENISEELAQNVVGCQEFLIRWYWRQQR